MCFQTCITKYYPVNISSTYEVSVVSPKVEIFITCSPQPLSKFDGHLDSHYVNQQIELVTKHMEGRGAASHFFRQDVDVRQRGHEGPSYSVMRESGLGEDGPHTRQGQDALVRILDSDLCKGKRKPGSKCVLAPRFPRGRKGWKTTVTTARVSMSRQWEVCMAEAHSNLERGSSFGEWYNRPRTPCRPPVPRTCHPFCNDFLKWPSNDLQTWMRRWPTTFLPCNNRE